MSVYIMNELCSSGQTVSAMPEAVFLWYRDRNIYAPSITELERMIRSQGRTRLNLETSGRLSVAGHDAEMART